MDRNKLQTESQERLLNLIPYGKENAVSREYLSYMLGKKDRMVRILIKELRIKGNIICSDSKSKGYWKPTKRSEVRDFITQMSHYGKQCFNAAKSAREYMKDHEDQLHA